MRAAKPAKPRACGGPSLSGARKAKRVRGEDGQAEETLQTERVEPEMPGQSFVPPRGAERCEALHPKWVFGRLGGGVSPPLWPFPYCRYK